MVRQSRSEKRNKTPILTISPITQISIRAIATGLAFLAIGFGLWFSILWLDALTINIQYSRHLHDTTYQPSALHQTIIFFYPLSFFTSALFLGRSAWTRLTIVITPLFYTVFLAATLVLPVVSFEPSLESILLIAPIICAILGSLVGTHFRQRIIRTEQGAAANP